MENKNPFLLSILALLISALLLFASSLDNIEKEINSSNAESALRGYNSLKTYYVNSLMSNNPTNTVNALNMLAKYAKNFGDDPNVYVRELKGYDTIPVLKSDEVKPKEPPKDKRVSSDGKVGAKIVEIRSDSNSISLLYDGGVDSSYIIKEFRLKEPLRYVYDIQGELATKTPETSFEGVSKVVAANNRQGVVRVVLHMDKERDFDIDVSGDTLTISNKGAQKTETKKSSSEPKNIDSSPPPIITPTLPPPKVEEEIMMIEEEPAPPISKFDTPQKGKIDFSSKVVVLDAGHGGKDCGALAHDKTCEKTLALQITKFVRDELKKEGFKKIYLTREKDVFIKLRDRTKIANDKNADIFVSIHLNSVPKAKASQLRGVETYFLSHARSERAKNVAAIENSDDMEDMDYFTKNTFLSLLNSKRIVESNKLAIDIQRGMIRGLKSHKPVDGGVREGPFWVLVGAQMPSVLVEVGYISHTEELRLLKNQTYQKQAARGIAEGIMNYIRQNG